MPGSSYFGAYFTMTTLAHAVDSSQSLPQRNRTQTACLGETVRIHCHSCSRRTADVRFQRKPDDREKYVFNDGGMYYDWRNRSKLLSDDEMCILQISNVQMEDAGLYRCLKSDRSSQSSVSLSVSNCTTPANCSCTEENYQISHPRAVLVICALAIIVLAVTVVVLAMLFCRSRKRQHQQLDHQCQIKDSEQRKSEEKSQATERRELIHNGTEHHTPVASSASSNVSASESTYELFLEPVGKTCRGERVRSVCVVDDRLYVARFKQTHIEVYDTCTMEQTDKLMAGGDGHAVPVSLAADEANKVLYTAYRDEKVIHMHNLNGKNKDDSKWHVDSKPENISVTADHTVVVTFRRPMKLTEYQSDGTLIREIILERDVVHPRCAISIIKNHFVICYGKLGETRCGVCVVSIDGTIIPRVDTRTTCPCHISIGPDRTLFVCDYNDGNVVMLDKNFQYADTVLDSSSCVNQPFTSCFDTSSKRIYIGEVSEVPGDSRVLSFSVCHRTQQ